MASNIDILFEDNHLLIVNKPAGIPSQSDLTQDVCILDLAKEYIKVNYNKPGNVYASLVHRIDRPVSGTLMLAKTSKAMTRMTAQFRERQIEKEYIAIVDRPVPEPHYHLEDYLLKNRKRNISRVVTPDKKDAKFAELHAQRGPSFAGFTLIKIQPKTGRSHQIRNQLAHVGLPIVGDVKYGGSRHTEKRAICLHSHSLTFAHPTTKEKMTVACLPYQHHWQDYGRLLVNF